MSLVSACCLVGQVTIQSVLYFHGSGRSIRARAHFAAPNHRLCEISRAIYRTTHNRPAERCCIIDSKGRDN